MTLDEKEQAEAVAELRAELVRLGRENAILRALALSLVRRVEAAGYGALAELMAGDLRDTLDALDGAKKP